MKIIRFTFLYTLIPVLLIITVSCGTEKQEKTQNIDTMAMIDDDMSENENDDNHAGSLKEEFFYPIVDGSWYCLLGAWTQDGWVQADSSIMENFSENEIYAFYDIDGLMFESGAGFDDAEEIGACYEVILMKFDTVPEEYGGEYLAISCPWDPFALKPVKLEKPDKKIIGAVRDFLSDSGMKSPKVKIESAYRIDIEGDGKDEVIVAAYNFAEETEDGGVGFTPPKAGDYSGVFIIRDPGTNPVAVPVAIDMYVKNEEYGLLFENKLIAMLDLNGDGKIEIVISNRYYEGDATIVFEIQDGIPKDVLWCGCGA